MDARLGTSVSAPWRPSARADSQISAHSEDQSLALELDFLAQKLCAQVRPFILKNNPLYQSWSLAPKLSLASPKTITFA